MATVYVELCSISNQQRNLSVLAVPDGAPEASEIITSSGVNQTSTATSNDTRQYWIVWAIGGDVFVVGGTTPDATSAPRYFVKDGTYRAIKAEVGDKLAVVNVA